MKKTDSSINSLEAAAGYYSTVEDHQMELDLFCPYVERLKEPDHSNDENRKTMRHVGFQVNHKIHQKLKKAAWRRKMSLSELLRMYVDLALSFEASNGNDAVSVD